MKVNVPNIQAPVWCSGEMHWATALRLAGVSKRGVQRLAKGHLTPQFCHEMVLGTDTCLAKCHHWQMRKFSVGKIALTWTKVMPGLWCLVDLEHMRRPHIPLNILITSLSFSFQLSLSLFKRNQICIQVF